ncbi:hypothetical protein KOI40_00190 [Aestuariicella sp. G3-2]|uniref:hypothetical protein n=1 Tax=Pseudomaricurvus albidus TaxID=2842452 RepID=UPI001C0ADADE|nr:hypothetical protein [Aestuariicella albida]MBU3068233.1 hypothetical protein [Aestuariicella albida]
MNLTDGSDAEDAAQALSRFIAMIHEVFKIFLKNGHYDTYVAEQYQIDADSFW